MGRRLNLQESEIRTLYVERGLTQREIAQEYGCNHRTIGRLMQRLGILARQQQRTETEHSCLNCGQITTNPKFCSSSCAAKYNNRHFPKRKKQKHEWVCAQCGSATTERRKYCDDCAPSNLNWLDRTIGELSRDGYSQIYRTVRALARRIYTEAGKPLRCEVCSYSAHIEISHIQAISSFDKETLIREVNRLDNLIALCPTHHWEFDNGLINLTAVRHQE